MDATDRILSSLLGSGMIFPIDLVGGAPVIHSGPKLIKSSIQIILSFHLGDKFFQGEMGSNLLRILEEPNDVVLRSLVEHFVTEAITKWEKRITLTTSSLIQDNDKLFLRLSYRINQTQVEDTFIYPFYNKVA